MTANDRCLNSSRPLPLTSFKIGIKVIILELISMRVSVAITERIDFLDGHK
jgi:hypothetical protein